MNDDDDLDEEPEGLDLRGMIREDDYHTSTAAAAHHEPKRNALQQRVEAALARERWRHVPVGLTDEELRLLPEFVADGYSESTVRKRRTELTQMGRVVENGERRNSGGFMMTVWTLAPPKVVRVRRSLYPEPPVARKRANG